MVPVHAEQRWDEISRFVLSDEPLPAIVCRLAGLAVDMVAGCRSCAITLVSDNGTVAVRGASDDIGGLVDDLQFDGSDGPGPLAVASGSPVVVRDFATDGRWPHLARRFTAEGVPAAMAVPLTVSGSTYGTVTFIAQHRAFGSDAEDAAQRVADRVSVPLANAMAFARAQDLVVQLNEALESRDVIGQAKGIIMAIEGCSADQAFDHLRLISQRSNVKLRDVAQRVVDERALPSA